MCVPTLIKKKFVANNTTQSRVKRKGGKDKMAEERNGTDGGQRWESVLSGIDKRREE